MKLFKELKFSVAILYNLSIGYAVNTGWDITFPWFCHLCQIPGITPSSVGQLKEMTAPREMCQANEELESPVVKK